MAIQENRSERTSGITVRPFRWINKNINWFGPVVLWGFMGLALGGVTLLNNNQTPERAAEAEAKANAQATATTLEANNLRADFNATGGLNTQRLEESYLFSPRGSARLASPGMLTDNAWGIVKKDGCQSLETLVLPDVMSNPSKPPKYIQIRVNCDPHS